MATTPSSWNPHLAKLVTDGHWSYAVFSSWHGNNAAENVAWIYRRREGPSTRWRYTGRRLNFIHQPPGIVLDRSGRLHVAFDCQGRPDARSKCTPGGAVANPGEIRFYDLIFWKHHADGSLELGTKPNRYRNYNEFTDPSSGYMGLGTNPSSGETYASISRGVDQLVFQAGMSDPPRESVPDEYVLYPQIVFSPTGVRYFIGTLFPKIAFPPEEKSVDEEEDGEEIGGGVILYRASDGFQLGFEDKSDLSCLMCQYSSDAAFGPDGRLYYLYYKRPYVGGVCKGPSSNSEATSSYLLIETAPGSGSFSDPVPVGCHNDYAQLQVDSAGTINILDTGTRQSLNWPGGRSGRKLDFEIDQSRDRGMSWREYCRTMPANAVPRGSDELFWPTLVKSWTSPAGYHANVLHGFVANAHFQGKGSASASANEFSIPIGPSRGRDKTCR